VHLSLQLAGQGLTLLFQLANPRICRFNLLFEWLQYGILLAFELPSLNSMLTTFFVELFEGNSECFSRERFTEYLTFLVSLVFAISMAIAYFLQLLLKLARQRFILLPFCKLLEGNQFLLDRLQRG
jgi:hypothetical protein